MVSPWSIILLFNQQFIQGRHCFPSSIQMQSYQELQNYLTLLHINIMKYMFRLDTYRFNVIESDQEC